MPKVNTGLNSICYVDESKEQPDYTTVEGLQQHHLWKRLSTKQQAFVLAYIQTNGDRIEAAKVAFTCKNDRAAETMAWRSLRTQAVRTLLSLYFEEEQPGTILSRREFLELMAARMRNPATPTVAFSRMAQVYMQIVGFRAKTGATPKGPGRPPKEPLAVDALVLEMESKQKV